MLKQRDQEFNGSLSYIAVQGQSALHETLSQKRKEERRERERKREALNL